MPAPHDAGRGRGIAEAQGAKGLERAGIVVAAGEHQVAAWPGQARRLLEQPSIVAFHAVQALEQVVLERLRIGIAQEGRDRRHAGLVSRQGVGLAVVDHLQAMLDGAQKTIGFDQFFGVGRRDVAGGGERAQGLAGAAQPERGIAAAEDELLGLGEELDFADAAAPQLDVVAQHLDRAAAAMGIDLALDRMDVVDGREIEMLAPDVGRELAQEGVADGKGAGHRMGLDHGRALPVLADALVVELGRLHRHGKRRRARVGTQPEVSAEDVAVGRGLRHELHQHPRAAHEMPRHKLVAAQRRRVAVVEQDEIDVARVVELAGAELAHAEHGERRRLGLAAEAELAVALELQQDRSGERVQAPGGEGAEFAGHPVERPGSGDVGDGDGQGDAALELAQPRRHHGRRRARARVGAHGLELDGKVAGLRIGPATP